MKPTRRVTISNIFGTRSIGTIPASGLLYPEMHVGPELELESVYLMPRASEKLSWWNITGDGSLRNKGMEFRAKEPLAGRDLISALSEYSKLKDLLRHKPTFSQRTGGHLHFNVTNMTAEEVAHIIMNFIVFAEETFFEIGRIKYDRKKEAYCRPLYLQEEMGHAVNLYLGKEYQELIVWISGNWGKYNSLYFNTGFGTLEFRMWNSTMSSIVLMNWINATADFINAARKMPVEDFSPSVHQKKARLKQLFPLTHKAWGRKMIITQHNVEGMPHPKGFQSPPTLEEQKNFKEILEKYEQSIMLTKQVKLEKPPPKSIPEYGAQTPLEVPAFFYNTFINGESA